MSGPVDVGQSTLVALRPLAFDRVELDSSGYFGAWQELNRSATLAHCIANLESNGTIDNLRRLVGRSSAEYRGMVFQDSDLYKTLEAVAWALGRRESPTLREFLEATAALLEEAQGEDGYLNSWVQGVHPERRWQDLRWGHEMYCAGHLIQAAVAAARVAGHDRLLRVARRFADLLVRHFGEGGQDGICGHPEIETALVELARLTGERSYTDLARRMIELRGHGLLGDVAFGRNYYQDHLPVREAVEATGHAVRQLYLTAGVTDLYLENGDRSLLEAMEKLWHDLFTTKTYLTGGHGSRHRGESFGDPYELPPDRAYTETCAAIASFQWNWRMLLATGRGRYADEMERALYNAIAVGVGSDGRSFFYTNPLQLRPGHDGSTEDAPSERLAWYACACCPPNLARLAASFQHYVATQDESGIQLHLFTSARINASGPFGNVQLEVETEYPWDGRLSIRVVEGRGPWTLSLRLPAWCESPSMSVDGARRDVQPDELGYVRLSGPWDAGTTVTLDLPMPTRLVGAHPRVDAVRGCGALMRGPLVYCVEEGDLGGPASVDDIALDVNQLPEAVSGGDSGVPPVVLEGPVRVVPTSADEPLYDRLSPRMAPPTVTHTRMRAIPYFRWANRGARAMRVWLPVAFD
jgi:DUF1680 family protein